MLDTVQLKPPLIIHEIEEATRAMGFNSYTCPQNICNNRYKCNKCNKCNKFRFFLQEETTHERTASNQDYALITTTAHTENHIVAYRLLADQVIARGFLVLQYALCA